MVQTQITGWAGSLRVFVLPTHGRRYLMLLGLCAQIACAQAAAQSGDVGVPHSYVPPDGFVPDSTTAIRVAEAVLSSIYPKEVLAGQRPFHATLGNGVWTVMGTLPEDTVGGVALVEIAKKDARILRVSHGK